MRQGRYFLGDVSSLRSADDGVDDEREAVLRDKLNVAITNGSPLDDCGKNMFGKLSYAVYLFSSP